MSCFHNNNEQIFNQSHISTDDTYNYKDVHIQRLFSHPTPWWATLLTADNNIDI